MRRIVGSTGWVVALLMLAGCDPQRISELEEGVSTEADVVARFGQPENVWDGSGGERIFEYNRQPAGHQNYMISIGRDGRMSALRQVLHPGTFARVQPGMMMEDVRKMLGKPMKVSPYPLQREVHYDWRWMQPPNTPMVFTVVFDPDYRVVRTGSVLDPESPDGRGGPSK
jgi:hypothetical protein